MRLDELLQFVRQYCVEHCEEYPTELRITLENGRKITHPIRTRVAVHVAESAESAESPDSANEISDYQQKILDALDGRGLRTDAIVKVVGGDRSRLHKRGGIKDLQRAGLIKHHSSVGYYRPDSPPGEFAESAESC